MHPGRALAALASIALIAVACGTSEDPAAGTDTQSAPKTCGIGLPAPCTLGERCVEDADCTTDVCEAGACVRVTASVHADGRRNGGETGKDCGGAALEDGRECPGGEPCKVAADCQGTACANGTCAPPKPDDGKKNGGESDVDCGGPNALKCVRGKACAIDTDCQLLACAGGTCGTPSPTDGIKNGGETDVDCGGPGVSEGDVKVMPPRCRDLRACAVDGDCRSGACAPEGRCVPRSCKTGEKAGIRTCGMLEVDDPLASHESCCKSLQLPTRATRRLDKYEITAGRFRVFLAGAGPNLRQWVATYVAGNPGSQLAAWMNAGPVLKNIFPATATGQLGVVAHMAFDIDNYGGSRGCYNGAGNYAHNTYWQDAGALSEFGIPARTLAREVTDAKSLNCAMPILFAAFCAWDGGELATMADYADAWASPQRFPWGAGDIGRPRYNWCNGYPPANGQPGTGGFTCQDGTLGDNGNFYRYPKGTNLANDLSPFIAAPGRFASDATSNRRGGEPWMDLFANLAEYTGDITPANDTFCDFSAAPGAGAPTCTRAGKDGPGTSYTGVPHVGIVGRTWEGHAYDQATAPGVVDGSAATFQYGKFGARCARPAEP